MYTPKGYTEEQTLAAITKALDGLVSSFAFGYYDSDDLRQEGFIMAVEKILPKFDPDHPKQCALENFLRLSLKRQFLNLVRNKFHRHAPPCLKCKEYRENGEPQCLMFDDNNECPKWLGWYNRNQSKRSLVEPGDVTKVTHVVPLYDQDVCSRLSHQEIIDHVSERIPLGVRADYCRFLEGAKLNKARREVVLESIKEIVGELLDGEKEDR
ncbi:MAG: hypothetical protein ACYS7Y_25325 [Planctomycetota bacterium]|jgi:hypothetical protein